MTTATREALQAALGEHPELVDAIANPNYGMDFNRDPLKGPDSEGATNRADQELA